MANSRVGQRYRKYLWDPSEAVVPRKTASRFRQVSTIIKCAQFHGLPKHRRLPQITTAAITTKRRSSQQKHRCLTSENDLVNFVSHFGVLYGGMSSVLGRNVRLLYLCCLHCVTIRLV